MSEFGKKLLESMEQAVEIVQGDMPKSDYVEHIVQVARAPERVDVKAIRKSMGMTQAGFAASFGLSLYTLRGWEQGKRKPDPAARAYLRVIEKAPDTVRAALAG